MNRSVDMSESERARLLYMKIESLGLSLRIHWDARRPEDRRVILGDLRSLTPAHAERLSRLVKGHESALMEILVREHPPDLRLVSDESSPE